LDNSPLYRHDGLGTSRLFRTRRGGIGLPVAVCDEMGVAFVDLANDGWWSGTANGHVYRRGYDARPDAAFHLTETGLQYNQANDSFAMPSIQPARRFPSRESRGCGLAVQVILFNRWQHGYGGGGGLQGSTLGLRNPGTWRDEWVKFFAKWPGRRAYRLEIGARLKIVAGRNGSRRTKLPRRQLFFRKRSARASRVGGRDEDRTSLEI